MLAIGLGAYVVISPLISQHGAATMPLDFCGHIFNKGYSQAYSMLTPDARGQITLNDFTTRVEGWRLTHCSTDYSGPRVLNLPTTIPMTFVQDNGGDTGLDNGSATIVQIGGGWKISAIVTPWGSVP